MWTIENYKEVYSRYQSSGLSVRDFCYNERISHSRFYYWRSRYLNLPDSVDGGITIQKVSKDNVSSPGFIPLVISSGGCEKSYAIKAKQETVASASSASSVPFMEICYQNGTCVRLSGEKDMELIKTLILLSR